MPEKPPHLTEVEFKLWWHLYTISERNQIQFIPGDFYSEIKERFPKRRVNNFEFRFKQGRANDKTEFYLTQNNFKVITRDVNYNWEEFEKDIKYGLGKLFPLLDEYLDLDHIHMVLNYQDLFDFEYKEGGIIEFLDSNLKLGIDPRMVDEDLNPTTADISLKYEIGEMGKLTFQSLTGNLNGVNGIVAMTQVDSKKEEVSLDGILEWTNKAHGICSDIYKNIIK